MSLPAAIRRFCGRFARDERGQALAFAALTFFGLVVMVLMITGISDVTSTQMEMQNAADSAALDGAQVKADCVAQIAWLNEAMACLWYQAQRQCAETGVAAVHARLKERPAEYGDANFAALFGGSKIPTDEVVGLPDAPGTYDRAWTASRSDIPRSYDWLKRLSRIQRGIAVLAPTLVENQIFHTARENGSELSCMYRSFTFMPAGPTYCYLDIERYKESERSRGWKMSGRGTSGEMSFKALHTPPDHTAGGPVSRLDNLEFPNGSVHDVVRYTGQPDRWDVELKRGADELTMRIDSDYAFDGDTGATLFPPPREAYALHDISLVHNGTPDRWWVYDYGDGNVAIIHPADGKNTEITRVDADPPYFKIAEGGFTYFIRPQPYGYDYTDDVDAQGYPANWQVIKRTGEEGDTVTIDGVEIPIYFPTDINIHRIELSSGVYVDLGVPHTIEWSGIMTATLGAPMSFSIIPIDPFWRIGVTDEEATVHGLSTARDADGRWRRIWHSDYWHDTDRLHHRIQTIEPENIDAWIGQWKYEWVREGSDMKEADMRRFACHGIMNYDPEYRTLGGSPTDDLGYCVSADASNKSWATNGPGASALWKYFPRWAQPPREEEAMATNTDDYGGWFNIGHVATSPLGKPLSVTSYHQTRTCWFCGADRDGLTPERSAGSAGAGHLQDYDPQSPTYRNAVGNRSCVRPCGFWYEQYEGLQFQVNATARRAAINAAFAADFPGRTGAIEISSDVAAMKTVIQVTCPVCARKELLRQRFLEQGKPAIYHPDNAPDAGAAREYLLTHPSVVRVYLAETIGAHDTGQPANPFSRTIRAYPDPALTDANRYEYLGVLPPQYNTTTPDLVWLPPLEVTSEIFRYGVTVATWKERQEGLLAGIKPDNRAVGMQNPLGYPSWGYFAMATSRLVFWNHVASGTPDRASARPAIAFDWTGSRPAWITEEESAIDILGRRINWDREQYLRTPLNLFDPDWNAALISNREAIDMRDVDFESDTGNEYIEEDADIAYLMRMIRAADWRRNASDGLRMERPEMAGMRIDFYDERMEDIMRH